MPTGPPVRKVKDRIVLPKGDLDQLALLGGDLLPTTPIRRQYLELKARHPDAILFFQLGDFYETFDDDARLVSHALEIVLTSRDIGRGERVPMSGVPYHAAEGYIARLIERGHRVALCDQIGEVPARGLVHREVVRVVTPGTLIEDGLLPARTNNFLAALLPDRTAAGLAHVDVSTGHLAVTEVSGAGWRSLLAAELVRLGPAECLVPAEAAEQPEALGDLLPPGARPTPRGPASFAAHRTLERLQKQFGTPILGSLGLDERPLAARATAALLEYVEETLPAALRLLDRVDLYAIEGSMVLDVATRRSLELTEGLRTGSRARSLLDVLDETRTVMGARLFRQWLSRPLLDPERIRARHDAVDALVDQRATRAQLGETLARLPDLERLAGRAAQRILTPRETLALAAGVRLIPELAMPLAGLDAALIEDIRGQLADFTSLAERIERTIEDPPPAVLGEGVIRGGCQPELDEIRAMAGDTRSWIANLERTERERTGVRGLRVGYNRVFGYYLEVSKGPLTQPTDYYQRERSGGQTVAEHLERLGYLRRQTVSNGERFIIPQLQEYEIRVRNAQEEIARLERRVYGELLDGVAEQARALLDSAGAVAKLDVLVSLADIGARYEYVRPELVEGDVIEIEAGRHPVVERFLETGTFVPNGTRLGGQHAQIAILTGPNMAGKSTYLRQVALIALMAHVGSFVPAAAARLGLVDRIFARVGAQDDLAAQRSTFMVEMIETANILRSASPRSLLVLDEIGRGTSTFDGIAVARAVVEHIHNSPRLGCKTLFATHYHELADLERCLPRAQALRMEVLEQGGQVVFLHRVASGAADRSYGVHVARLAGVPEPVIRRAARVLAELEQQRQAPPSDSASRAELSEDAALSEGVREALRRLAQVDPLRMTPLEALAELSELASLVAGSE